MAPIATLGVKSISFHFARCVTKGEHLRNRGKSKDDGFHKHHKKKSEGDIFLFLGWVLIYNLQEII
jgi:hypothetical protein